MVKRGRSIVKKLLVSKGDELVFHLACGFATRLFTMFTGQEPNS